MSPKYKFPDLMKTPLKGFVVQETDGRGLKSGSVVLCFRSCVTLTTIRKGVQEPQLISAGIAGPATSRNYRQLKMAEEGKSGMNMWGLTSEGLRCEIAGRRRMQSWNGLNKKLLIMITVNNAGERQRHW